MTIKETLLQAKKQLQDAKIGEPNSSAEFLLRTVLGCTRTELFSVLEQEMGKKENKKYQIFLKKRLKHMPVWQITGLVDFYGRNFLVTTDVLVPRPETEFLIEQVLKEIRGIDQLEVLDVGTGSGTIIVTLASEIGSRACFYASDVSIKALKVAKKNAKLNKVDKLIKFKKSDLFKGWKGQDFDIICANLPYIPHEEMDTLALDIMHYEPRVALDGGAGGMELYHKFFMELPKYLKPNGRVFCEIGHNQGPEVKKLVKKYLPRAQCTILKDLAAIDRIVVIKLT